MTLAVAKPAMGQPFSKASNGGWSDGLRKPLDFTEREFQYGLEA